MFVTLHVLPHIMFVPRLVFATHQVCHEHAILLHNEFTLKGT